MKFLGTKIKGVYEIANEPFEDHRGYFMRTYDVKEFQKLGLDRSWVQENHSFSKEKGTLRGIHFQLAPHCEAKLIRAVRGEIFMVYVDLRKDSQTFGQWSSVVLSEENKKMLFVPKGMGLGMYALSDNCSLLYKMDHPYVPEAGSGIKWDDPDIGVKWPIDGDIVISEKDQNAMSFKEFRDLYGSLEVES